MRNFQPFLVHHSPASRKRVPLSRESSWAKTTWSPVQERKPFSEVKLLALKEETERASSPA